MCPKQLIIPFIQFGQANNFYASLVEQLCLLVFIGLYLFLVRMSLPREKIEVMQKPFARPE